MTNDASRAERRKPIALLADSQLLFWKQAGGHGLLAPLVREVTHATAAYVGASNGDLPEFYELFVVAMSELGISACCHVHTAPHEDELAFLAQADLILLAGGNTARGLRIMQSNGVAELVVRRYHEGCVLVGVSAGAIQLGRHVILEQQAAATELLPGIGLIPYVLDVHQAASDWICLSRTVHTLEGSATGLGIPAGGGLLFHADGTLEPVRSWAHEFTLAHGRLQHRMLLPAEPPATVACDTPQAQR